MALQVWLPLDGDLHNQGCDMAVFSKTTNVWGTGKIGGQALLTSTGTGNVMINNLKDKQEFSIAYWIKVDSSLTFSNWQDIWALDYINSTGTYPIRDEHNSTAGQHQLIMAKETNVGSNTNGYIGMTIANDPDNWQHIVLTKNTTQTKSYVNGELKLTRNNTDFEASTGKLSGNVRIGATTCGAYLNDFRVYDHCLSAEEVREIANGLVLHYKLDSLNNNLLIDKPAQYNPTSYTAYLLSTVTTLTAGTYTVQLWDVDLYHSAATANQISVKLALGGINGSVMLVAWAGNAFSADGETNYHADYLTTQFNLTNNNISQVGAGGWIEIYNSITSSGTYNMHIGAWKLEKGSVASEWTSQNCDATRIIDESGYHHHGTITGNIQIASNSSRYSNCIYTPSGDTDYITTPTLQLPGDFITMNFWFKSSNKSPGSGYHMPLEGTANSNQAYEMSIYQTGYLRGGLVVAGSRRVDNCTSTKLTDGKWHMCTMTYDGSTIKRYVDGVMEKSTAVTGALATSSSFVLGRYGSSTSYYSKESYTSDVRIYCTALSDTEILKLYNSGMIFDKNKQIHTHKFNEFAIPALHKTAILDGQINEALYCPYDPNIYIEPDGSKWVHIFHQNNASSNLFASTDTFNTKVYKNENAWFYVSLCHHITSWEFLGVNKEETTSTEKRYRWIQNINPMVATFNDVPAANITRITNGYTSSSWGGLYRKNANTCLCLNNAQSGNWWGAIGAWALSTSGVPALTGTVTKTGYIDLYVRVDNTTFVNHILHNNIDWLADQFIEK